MIAQGTKVYTRRGYLLVEDIEDEDFPVPHPTRGFAFVRCGDVIPIVKDRILLMLVDGRDLIVASDLSLFTEGGTLVSAAAITPGTSLTGPEPGVVEGVSQEKEGTVFDIPTLHGVPFVVNGLSVLG